VAACEQVFDVEYVNRIMERLDRTGIEAVRRSQVVKLLKNGLRQTLAYWQSCIDQIGNEPQLPPKSLARSATKVAEATRAPTSSSSKLLYVDVSKQKYGTAHKSRHLPSSDDSSNMTSDRDSADDHAASESEYVNH
jgi:hypothetical protein